MHCETLRVSKHIRLDYGHVGLHGGFLHLNMFVRFPAVVGLHGFVEQPSLQAFQVSSSSKYIKKHAFESDKGCLTPNCVDTGLSFLHFCW